MGVEAFPVSLGGTGFDFAGTFAERERLRPLSILSHLRHCFFLDCPHGTTIRDYPEDEERTMTQAARGIEIRDLNEGPRPGADIGRDVERPGFNLVDLAANSATPRDAGQTTNPAQRDGTLPQLTIQDLNRHEQFGRDMGTAGRVIENQSLFDRIDRPEGFLGLSGRDGRLTREELEAAVNIPGGAGRGRGPSPEALANREAIRTMLDNWDKPEFQRFKQDGAVTPQSFRQGMEQEQRDIAAARASRDLAQTALEDRQEADRHRNVQEAQRELARREGRTNPVDSLPDAILQAARVRRGEGPYQVAARLLSAPGEHGERATRPSHQDVMALTRALQAQMPESERGKVLRVNQGLLTRENAQKVMEALNPALRARLFRS